MADTIENREYPRIEARWPITVSTDEGTIKGATRNISVDGICIHCEKPIRLNEIYPMSILPPNHQIIELTGKVIWSDFYGIDDKDTAVALGVSFVEISDEHRHFFNDVVSVHLA